MRHTRKTLPATVYVASSLCVLTITCVLPLFSMYLQFLQVLSLCSGLHGQFSVFLMELIVRLFHFYMVLLLALYLIQKHCLLLNTHTNTNERHGYTLRCLGLMTNIFPLTLHVT